MKVACVYPGLHENIVEMNFNLPLHKTSELVYLVCTGQSNVFMSEFYIAICTRRTR